MNDSENNTDISDERIVNLLNLCRQHNITLATAESCTGGLIAASLTQIAGSSDVVDCGFITYSNEAKSAILGVDAALIEKHSAVSVPVAHAMAAGALKHSNADIAIAVTGIAGPGGGTKTKPVGLVHLAAQRRNGRSLHEEVHFSALSRTSIRQKTVLRSFDLIEQLILG